MNKGLAEAESLIMRVLSAIEHWLETRDGKSFPLRYKRSDQIRLLRLYGWELKYMISIEDILDIIVPALRAHIHSRKKARGIGIMVRSLVGDASERVLKYAIAKRYPQNEHIQVWKSRERELQLYRERREELDGMEPKQEIVKGLLDYASLDIYISRYKDKIAIIRKREVLDSIRKRRKKPYRWNPWL
jgi:hypothetical protein